MVAECAERDEHDRNADAGTGERPARQAAPRAHRLRDHQRPRPGAFGVAGLVPEEADSAVDERDVARLQAGEVARRAAEPGAAQAAGRPPRAGVAQDLELPGVRELPAADGKRGTVEPEVGEWNGLAANLPAGVLKPGGDVLGRRLVAGRARRSGPAVGVGDPLKRLE